jgi:aspartyl protease family protein
MNMPPWLIALGAAFFLVAVVVPIGFASRYKASIGWLSAMLALWVILAGLFGFLYLRQEAYLEATLQAQAPASEPTVATATPAAPSEESDLSSVHVTANADGQFFVTGLVNGGSVQFQVDPSSDLVILTGADAKRAGLDPDRLSFGNGNQQSGSQTGSARVVIYQLAVGPIRLVNVEGQVDVGGRSNSVLGKSFLERIGGYEVNGSSMVLRK